MDRAVARAADRVVVEEELERPGAELERELELGLVAG